MSKIFIFAFNTYYPSGGMDSLKAVLDNETGQRTNSDMLVVHDALKKVADVYHHDHYQVLHFTEDGGPLLVENWVREMPPGAPAEDRIVLSDDDVLRRVSLTHDFPGEVDSPT